MYFGNVNYYSKNYNYDVWPVRSGQVWSFGDLLVSGDSQFGKLQVGSTTTSRQFSIGNRTAADLTIRSIAITGANGNEFSVVPGGTAPCSTLAPTLAAGARCTVLVKYAPVVAGAKSASLTITTAADNNVPLTASAFTTVYGTITDYATGLPLAGATVTRTPDSTSVTTAGDGSYNFGSLASGTYSVSISKTGYQTQSFTNLSVSTTASAKVDTWLPTTGFLNIPAQSVQPAFTATAYSYRVRTAGGTYPYTYKIAWGTLPSGLTLNAATGIISGTPAAGADGDYTFAVGVTDTAAGYAEATLTINVSSPLTITTATLPDAHVGSPYSQTVIKNGGIGPYTFGYTGPLPAGLSLNTSTGVISGTPTTPGYVNFGITVTDSTWPTPQSPSQALSIRTVLDLPLTVQLTGTGSGTVTSTPAQVNCTSGTCPYQVGTGTTLLLHAEPANGSTFTGWSNACTGTTDCSLLMSGAKTAVANFTVNRVLTVTMAGNGSGTIVGNPSGIVCTNGSCSYSDYPLDTTVTLLNAPSIGSLFSRYSGDCIGMSCSVSMSADRSVTATFTSPKPVKIDPTFYDSLQLAYRDAPLKGGLIMLKEGVLTGSFTADADKSVTIEGGYDPAYTGPGHDSIIAGSIVLKYGTVILDGVSVR